MEYLFPIIFLAFVGYFVFSVFTKSGRGRMFGGKIIRTLDREIKTQHGMLNRTIKVHSIDNKKTLGKSVTIEINQHAYLAWNMTPINLSKEETKKLIGMLQEIVT